MRIAVSFNKEDETVFPHFGETEYFKIYDEEDGNIQNSTVLSTSGISHGALVSLLKNWNVNLLLCGRIGQGAQSRLEHAGIRFYGECSGKADQAVRDYLHGKLQ